MEKTKKNIATNVVMSVVSFFNEFHPVGHIEIVSDISQEEEIIKLDPSFVTEWAKK